MPIPGPGQLRNRVKTLRLERGWSQDELARRAGLSRPAVSAIEIERLVPSVAAALALAATFECKVEDLFFDGSTGAAEPTWAWAPTSEPTRYWQARVGERTLLYPVESLSNAWAPHDGVFEDGVLRPASSVKPENTIVMASCDPAAGLLACELGRTTDYRLIVLPRASRAALDLLHQGLVHVAGMHLATGESRDANAEAARSILGPGYSLFSVATWQEGLTLGPGVDSHSVKAILKSKLRWVGREPGSGARQCQDEVLQDNPAPRRLARDHRGVAEAIRCGWADVGVCVRLVSEEAGLQFVSVRDEAYDLCYPTVLESDPRLRTLLTVLRSRTYRGWLTDLPGYDCQNLGAVSQIQ